MRILIFILSLIPFFGICQTEDSAETVKKFAIGINYSIDQTFRTLSVTDGANSQDVKDSRDSREEPSINYTVGLNFNYLLSTRLSLEIGVLYAKVGYQTKETALTYSNLQDPRNGFTVDTNNLPVSEKYNVNHAYLNIPLELKVFLTNNKVKFFLSGGFSTNIFLNSVYTNEWEFSDGSTYSDTEKTRWGAMYKVNMTVVLGVGIDYSFMDKYKLRINPIYRRSISPIADWATKEYPYSYGINLGVYYTFKK